MNVSDAVMYVSMYDVYVTYRMFNNHCSNPCLIKLSLEWILNNHTN